MEPVQVEGPKVSALYVGKGRPEVGAITKCPDDSDDSNNNDGSSSPVFTTCEALC